MAFTSLFSYLVWESLFLLFLFLSSSLSSYLVSSFTFFIFSLVLFFLFRLAHYLFSRLHTLWHLFYFFRPCYFEGFIFISLYSVHSLSSFRVLPSLLFWVLSYSLPLLFSSTFPFPSSLLSSLLSVFVWSYYIFIFLGGTRVSNNRAFSN